MTNEEYKSAAIFSGNSILFSENSFVTNIDTSGCTLDRLVGKKYKLFDITGTTGPVTLPEPVIVISNDERLSFVFDPITYEITANLGEDSHFETSADFGV